MRAKPLVDCVERDKVGVIIGHSEDHLHLVRGCACVCARACEFLRLGGKAWDTVVGAPGIGAKWLVRLMERAVR